MAGRFLGFIAGSRLKPRVTGGGWRDVSPASSLGALGETAGGGWRDVSPGFIAGDGSGCDDGWWVAGRFSRLDRRERIETAGDGWWVAGRFLPA